MCGADNTGEAANFQFPVVCVRICTEQPKAINRGNFFIGSITTEQVLQTVDMSVAMNKNGDLGVAVPDYVDENVSTTSVKFIQNSSKVIRGLSIGWYGEKKWRVQQYESRL